MTEKEDGRGAIHQYLMELKPQTRLDYYHLESGERNLLRAMCCFSPNGACVDKPLPQIAERASMDRRTAQRIINGYTRKGIRKIGLRARGILSESAPAHPSRLQAAIYRINWDALAIDPNKMHILQKRMQGTLPGMKSPTDPEHDPLQKPVNSPRIPEDFHPLPRGTVPPPSRHGAAPLAAPCPHPLDTVPPHKDLGFDLGSNSLSEPVSLKPAPPEQQRGVVHFAGNQQKADFSLTSQKTKAQSAWSRLHPGLRTAIGRELDLLREASVGSSSASLSTEQLAQVARNLVLVACDRAKIWRHVAEALAEETYQAVLLKEKSKGEA